MKIDYSTTSRIWLSLEDYYNAGLAPEQAKTEIEKIRIDLSGNKLRCEPMGFNGNWIVEVPFKDPGMVNEVVSVIEYALDQSLTGS